MYCQMQKAAAVGGFVIGAWLGHFRGFAAFVIGAWLGSLAGLVGGMKHCKLPSFDKRSSEHWADTIDCICNFFMQSKVPLGKQRYLG